MNSRTRLPAIPLITGCPRSGTTALAQFLNTDPRVFITQEMEFLVHRDDPGFYRYVRHAAATYPSERMLWASRGLDLDGFADVVESGRLTGLRAFSLLRQLLPRSFVGDKAPMTYLQHMGDILRVEQAAVMIICERDGRGVVASQLRHGLDATIPDRWWHAQSVLEAEPMWLRAIEATRRETALCDPSRFIIIRYDEDTVSKPCDTIAPRVSELMGLRGADSLVCVPGYQPVHLDFNKRQYSDGFTATLAERGWEKGQQ